MNGGLVGGKELNHFSSSPSSPYGVREKIGVWNEWSRRRAAESLELDKKVRWSRGGTIKGQRTDELMMIMTVSRSKTRLSIVTPPKKVEECEGEKRKKNTTQQQRYKKEEVNEKKIDRRIRRLFSCLACLTK